MSDRPPLALGIDIGGTSIRAGLVNAGGRVVVHAAAPTPTDGDPGELSATLAALAGPLISSHSTCPDAGVVLPGLFDRATGVMQRAVNLPRLDGINLCELFNKALGRRVRLDTDVVAAGCAQWRSLRPQAPRFVYLALGTGVGGCVVLDGQVVRHTRGGAGQLGHLIVDASPQAPRCRCGGRGCLEAVLAEEKQASGGIASATSNVASEALAIALVQIAHVYAPDTIALGGGVCEHAPELVARTRAAFDRRRTSLVPADLRIVTAPLRSDEAGIIGAALLATGPDHGA